MTSPLLSFASHSSILTSQFYIILFYPILFYSILSCSILFCTTLFFSIQRYSAPVKSTTFHSTLFISLLVPTLHQEMAAHVVPPVLPPIPAITSSRVCRSFRTLDRARDRTCAPTLDPHPPHLTEQEEEGGVRKGSEEGKGGGEGRKRSEE